MYIRTYPGSLLPPPKWVTASVVPELDSVTASTVPTRLPATAETDWCGMASPWATQSPPPSPRLYTGMVPRVALAPSAPAELPSGANTTMLLPANTEPTAAVLHIGPPTPPLSLSPSSLRVNS